MKCSRCGRELSEEQVYAYQGKPYCDDCLMETSLQKQDYDFIKGKGKATRAEVCKSLKLSEAEIDAQLTPLMFAKLVKERSEKGQTYLVAVR